jgi:hypothetical protein
MEVLLIKAISREWGKIGVEWILMGLNGAVRTGPHGVAQRPQHRFAPNGTLIDKNSSAGNLRQPGLWRR